MPAGTKHKEIQNAIVQEFARRFAPGAKALYVRDAAQKHVTCETKALAALNIRTSERGALPDVVLYDAEREWLYLLQAATLRGPIDSGRRAELELLFSLCAVHRVYVSAFLTRADFGKYLADIAWESEVWMADVPDHMIHFNGRRPPSPYNPEHNPAASPSHVPEATIPPAIRSPSMKTIDFSKELKDLYTAKRKPQEVVAGPGTFLAVEGQGQPGGEAFQQAIQQLYTVVYTMKFGLRDEKQLDFKVGRLECLYLSPPAQTPIEQWQWRCLVRIPDEYSAKDLAAVKKMICEKKGADTAAVKRVRWKEGRAVQVMHVGPYDHVGPIYEQLSDFAQEQGLEAMCPAHEIYLNDPRRNAPEKLKTIVRLAVK